MRLRSALLGRAGTFDAAQQQMVRSRRVGFDRAKTLLRYGAAAVGAWVALLVWFALPHGFEAQYPYSVFYPAVAIAALLFGLGEGLLTTAVSGILVAYFVLPPQGAFKIDRPDDLLALELFLITGAVISVVAGRYRTSRRHALDLAFRLREYNRLLEARVLERTAELQASVEARDNLLAVVSHDLRNPLTSIQLSARLMASEGRLDPPSRHHDRVELILRCSERMNHLIDDLLQASAIEAGAFTVKPSCEDVVAIVSEVIQTLRPVAAARSVALIFELCPVLPEAWGDRQRIAQVLGNLIGNAIKFTPEGGEVRIRAQAQADGISVAVADTGPGIAEEVRSHIFERFWRDRSRGSAGVGLGLYIARAIVEAHSGRIWVESSPGAGATFHFTLPLAAVAAPGPSGPSAPSGPTAFAPAGNLDRGTDAPRRLVAQGGR